MVWALLNMFFFLILKKQNYVSFLGAKDMFFFGFAWKRKDASLDF